VVFEDGVKYVHQQSEIIGDAYIEAVYADRESVEDVGVRQIQVDPSKFLRAKVVSEVLTERNVLHAKILDAQDCQSYGTAMLHFIEGAPGSSLLTTQLDTVWDSVGAMMAGVHTVPHQSLAEVLGHDQENMEKPDWLEERFTFLLSRLNASIPEIDIDLTQALDAYHNLFNLLPTVDRPICLTYDDAKPDALMFQEISGDPYIIDMESFTIGHRIIDGIGRALYWGPIREPVKQGKEPDYNARHHIARAYNSRVPKSWSVSSETVDLWCIASELFWLPDVAATHSIAPFLPAARLQGTGLKIKRLTNLLDALQHKDVAQAKEATFS
jgi:hypothetical protein